MTCEVCEVQKQNDPDLILFENDDWVIVLRPDDQLYLGKSVVSLKEHRPTLSDLSDEQWLSFAECSRWLETHMNEAFQPTHFNWQCLMNLGVAHGVTHVHWHCVPRYDREVEFAGETFVDADWPKAVQMMGEKRQVSREVLHEIAEMVRRAESVS